MTARSIVGAIVCVLSAAPHACLAVSYPTKPIRLISAFVPGGGSPGRFGAFLKAEIAKWSDIIRQAGIATR